MRDLRLTLVQSELFWEDKAGNLRHIEGLLAEQQLHTDLILLPEMFTTGFTMNIGSTGSSIEGSEVAWMQSIAKKYSCYVAGSLHIEEEKKHYNRLLVVNEEGILAQYDKRHLFGMAGEHKAYEKGTEPLICLINDWRVNLQICYDLRFPVWSRNNNNYDLLVYVANWPARRGYAWRQLLRARAIENQSFVAAVNRVGTDGNQLPYQGDSCVINPMGEAIWQLADVEAVKQITISASELQEVRANLPFLQDRDDFKLL
jgi:predicted amidohydrolase